MIVAVLVAVQPFCFCVGWPFFLSSKNKKTFCNPFPTPSANRDSF